MAGIRAAVSFLWCCAINGVLSQVRQQLFRCSDNSYSAGAHRWLEGPCDDPELLTFFRHCALSYSDVDWHCVGCTCYHFSPSSLVTYDTAKSKCEALGSSLIIIESAEENAAVWDIIETNGYIPVPSPSMGYVSYYLGWYNGAWQDGSEAIYRNFQLYDPFQFAKCAAMAAGTPPLGAWYSRACTTLFAYICEIEF